MLRVSEHLWHHENDLFQSIESIFDIMKMACFRASRASFESQRLLVSEHRAHFWHHGDGLFQNIESIFGIIEMACFRASRASLTSWRWRKRTETHCCSSPSRRWPTSLASVTAIPISSSATRSPTRMKSPGRWRRYYLQKCMSYVYTSIVDFKVNMLIHVS